MQIFKIKDYFYDARDYANLMIFVVQNCSFGRFKKVKIGKGEEYSSFLYSDGGLILPSATLHVPNITKHNLT